jgi:hypothetical protein
VAGSSINPDVVIAPWPCGPSLVRALTAVPRYEFHARLFPLVAPLPAVDAREHVFARSALPCPCGDDADRHGWSSSVCLMGASTQPRMDGSGPKAGFASIAFPQRLRRLFSPAAKRRHSSRDKKAV